MAARIISDEVWDELRALLPDRPPRRKGGRPPLGDREVLTGLLFVLKTGISWEDLPEEMGCGCGMTCLRRLKLWQDLQIWPQIQQVLEKHLRHADRYDWDRVREAVLCPLRMSALDNNLGLDRAAMEYKAVGGD